MNVNLRSLKKELIAVEGFVKRQMTLSKRYFGWEIVFLFYTMVHTMTIALIGAATGRKEQILFLVIGAVLWGFLSVIFEDIAETIAWERWEGTIEYTFMAPIRRFTHMFAVCASAIVYGTMRTVLVMIMVAVFFDLDLGRANLFSASIVLIASSLSFMGLGIMAAVLPILSPEKGPQATHIFQALILLVSGVYYDVSVLPSFLQTLSVFSPATYTLRSMRSAILQGEPCANMMGNLLILIMTGVLLIPLGLYIFSLAERYAMRVGLLKRQG